MRNKAIFLFLFSIWTIQYGFGQKEWAPIGAKWFINSPVSLGGGEPPDPILKDYYTVESLKDTMVDNVSYRLVGDYLTRQEGGNIYYLYRDTLRLIYSFDVNVGDTITFNMLDCVGNGIDLPYKVDTVDAVYVGNDTLKRVVCNTLTNNNAFPAQYEYIEKIGSTRTLIEDMAGCIWIPEYGPEWLRCYQDDDIHYKPPRFLSYGDYDCDYVEPVTSLETLDSDKFNVYPNPTTDMIKINCENHAGNLTIYGITGEQVLATQFQDRIELNISEFQNGLYVLNFVTTTGEIFNKQIVKY